MVTVKVAGVDVPVADVTPPGVISAFGGSVAPSGWLLCNGQAVSRTTYSALFVAIGTSFGAGDGSTTFNLPGLSNYSLFAVGPWTSYALSIGATVTAPTKGTVGADVAQWRRIGTDMEIFYNYYQSAAGSGGSGSYLFPLPAGYTVDVSKLGSAAAQRFSVGEGHGNYGSYFEEFDVQILESDTSNFRLVAYTTSGANVTNTGQDVGSANFGLSGTPIYYSAFLRVPVSQWATSLGSYIIKA